MGLGAASGGGLSRMGSGSTRPNTGAPQFGMGGQAPSLPLAGGFGVNGGFGRPNPIGVPQGGFGGGQLGGGFGVNGGFGRPNPAGYGDFTGMGGFGNGQFIGGMPQLFGGMMQQQTQQPQQPQQSGMMSQQSPLASSFGQLVAQTNPNARRNAGGLLGMFY